MNYKSLDSEFYYGLENYDEKHIAMIPKSDVHNHAGRGGKIEDLSSDILPADKPFASLDEMQAWFDKNVKARLASGIEGYLIRVEASFKQANMDNIKKLALSFGSGEVYALGGIERFTSIIDSFKQKYIPDSEFIPELSLLRSNISSEEISEAKEIISYGWFKSLDICGNEHAAPVSNYRLLYRYAKSKELLLKAHVGEFGTAEDVVRAVDLLELDEVHHGIAAADSRECMSYLEKNKIILNVCPMSNIMLKRVENYENHPIRKLYDSGVPITINTDDLTIFNATVTDEYLNLFKKKVFSKKELNEIRLGGLRSYGKYDK